MELMEDICAISLLPLQLPTSTSLFAYPTTKPIINITLTHTLATRAQCTCPNRRYLHISTLHLCAPRCRRNWADRRHANMKLWTYQVEKIDN
jgi:hypothetical protein